MPTILWWWSGRIRPLSALLCPAESLSSDGPMGLWGLGKNQTNLLTPARRTADMWNCWHKQIQISRSDDLLCSRRRRSRWPFACGTFSSWRERGSSPPCLTPSWRYTRVRWQFASSTQAVSGNSTEGVGPQTHCLTPFFKKKNQFQPFNKLLKWSDIDDFQLFFFLDIWIWIWITVSYSKFWDIFNTSSRDSSIFWRFTLICFWAVTWEDGYHSHVCTFWSLCLSLVVHFSHFYVHTLIPFREFREKKNWYFLTLLSNIVCTEN